MNGYPPGPALTGLTPGKAEDRPLPPLFDDTCKKCDATMERMPALCWTRHKPFAVFQCPDCKARLFLFDAPTRPLLVWSSSISSGSSINFSDFVDHLIKEREHKREVRAAREQAVPAEP